MKIPGTWMTALLKILPAGVRSRRPGEDIAVKAVLTHFLVKPAWQDKFLEVLRAYIYSSLHAAGNIMAEACYEHGDGCTMWLLERWTDQSSYRDNKESVAAKVVSALAKIGLTAPAETILLKDLEPARARGDWKFYPTSDRLLTIMLFIHVKAGARRLFRSINHDVVLALEKESRVLFFQLSQLSGERSRFIVYKKFHDWDAFEYHLKHPALAPLVKFLQHSVKDPPYEKGYHQLIQFAPQQGIWNRQ